MILNWGEVSPLAICLLRNNTPTPTHPVSPWDSGVIFTRSESDSGWKEGHILQNFTNEGNDTFMTSK